MGKIHTFTAIAAFIFIVIMLFVIVQPVDFSDANTESIYHNNVGLIWFIGIGSSALILMMTYINGTYQSELNKKTDQINTYNREILQNQMNYIHQVDDLTSAINGNVAQVNKQNETIDKVYKRVEDSEDEIQKFMKIHEKIEAITARTNSIENLLKEHNREIDILKRKN